MPPPYPTWVGMLSLAGLDHIQAPWLADALRNLQDPRLKGG